MDRKIPQNDIIKRLSPYKFGAFEDLKLDLVSFFLPVECKNSPADKKEAISHPELLKWEECL